MGKKVNSSSRIAIATINPKAYYKLVNLLKSLQIPFESIVPGDKVKFNIQLILTTKNEMSNYLEKNVICLEEIMENISLGKEKIFSVIYRQGKDILLTGIDPGENTGIISYYREKKVFEDVTGSIEDTISQVSRVVNNSMAKKKIIRIGDGNLKKAHFIAEALNKNLINADVEIVDEQGTSNLMGNIHLREPKDIRSARIISFRYGKKYCGIN